MQAGEPNLTELAAAKFIESHGRDGLRILDERAELAEELGHKVAAKTWRNIAAAAARILRIERVHPSLPQVVTRQQTHWWR